MRLNSLLTLSFVTLITLTGCGGGGSTAPVTPSETNETIIITEVYQVESLGSAKTINASVSLGNLTKDLYLVLSNSADVSGSSTITHNAKVSPVAQEKVVSTDSLVQSPLILRTPQYVQDFTSQVSTLINKAENSQLQAKTISIPERMNDSVNDTGQFCTNVNLDTGNCTDWTNATARKIVSDIGTAFGNKTLNIWVSDDSFDESGIGTQCQNDKCITQTMIDQLADKFLYSGSNNDIYDWVTNIYDEEWGSNAEVKYSYLIPEDNEITILLTDIDNDGLPGPNEGRVVGFFWSKDNFKSTTISGSNERVMFYIDSVMFANEEGVSWEIDDYWPEEMVSTLAHEFQHMIHYYQKNILLYSSLSTNTDTWISEMLSESTEDLIATKIGHSVEGRYPLFNANNTLSLTAWNNELRDYSKVNVFGAYLLRNYGGATLLHDIMHNSYDDEWAVVDAVRKTPQGSDKTFADLLNEWGVAVMLSDHDNLDVDTPVYNNGALFEDVYGSITYYMNSINLFDYNPPPTTYTTIDTVQPHGNYYYRIGENLTGDINVTLELNGQTEATLIAK